MARQSQTARGKLSDVARHLLVPDGIVSTEWPSVLKQCLRMGVHFDEWQDGLGRLILSKNADGDYATSIGGVVMSIPRQVGKTFLLGALVFALCMLKPNLTVLWTAHHTRTTDETFDALKGFARRLKIVPWVEKIQEGNGKQMIAFTTGSRILFGARERGFGRGFQDVDVEVFDEAQILTESAIDDMVPAMNAADNPLLILAGTPPKPKDPSEVFESKRLQALSGKLEGMAYVEMSADEDADPDDEGQWVKANPSYPVRTPKSSIQRMRANLSDDSFMREALGVWDTSKTSRVIGPEEWAAVADPASMATDRLTLAVDVAPDRSMAAVALAGVRPDGLWHVEVYEHRSGSDWVGPWVQSKATSNQLHAVVVDEMSGLVEKRGQRHYLIGTEVPVTLAKAAGRDMAIACAQIYDAVQEQTVRHTDQPQMNVALSVARKRAIGDGWAWNRKTADSDITPIVAGTLALWGVRKNDVARPGRAGRQSTRRAVVM